MRAGLGEMVSDGRGGLRPESWVGFHTFRHTAATLLFKGGLNAKQVQVWLGHHSPGFTLATYVHLLPDDLPGADFLDALTVPVGNEGAPEANETSRNRVSELGGASAPFAAESSDVPRAAEAR